MTIDQYLEKEWTAHGIARGRIPALLGFSNPNKALRRYDAFLAGAFDDADMLSRLRSCSLLAGDGFDQALAESIAKQELERRERALEQELKDRRSFVPHLYAEHEKRIPEHPFFAIAFLGINHFKRIDVPEEIMNIEDTGQRLLAVKEFIDNLVDAYMELRVLGGPFGKVLRFLFRDTFDVAYVYDINERAYTDVRTSAPPEQRVSLTINKTPLPKWPL